MNAFEPCREFTTRAEREGWEIITEPDHGSYYGRTEVRRREGRENVYVAIETDSRGRIIRATISYGADRLRARSPQGDKRRCALAWLGGLSRG